MPNSHSDPNIGRTLVNRYQLVELVGKGAMGQVYLAKDVRVGGVSVAVKLLSQALLNKKMRDRFEREATTSALLGQNSMHIVRVTDYGLSDDIPFYVMEYLQGESLGEIVREQRLPVPRFLKLTRQICSGLQCAHEGIQKNGKTIPIVHRDIKPSNILVSKDQTLGELVKILDFGIAKLLQEDAGMTNCFMGTLAYSSPEQMEGKELTNCSDLYSLGVMMFQMLTGQMPLQAETHTFGGWYQAHYYQKPRTFDAVDPSLGLPKALEDLVLRCLAKDPKDRPQSANEILNALAALDRSYSPPQSSPPPIVEPPKNQLVPVEPTRPDLPTPDELCRLQSWPKNKPLAQIVFPQVIQSNRQSLATLWAMLSKREIEQRQFNRFFNKLYKNFLCSMAPHPMVLWLTVLYNKEQGPRWLRCYLDLKSAKGQEIARLLGETGSYQLLFFTLEEPHTCAQVMTVTLNPEQCRKLQDWANSSRTMPATQPALSKNLLKQEFEKLQPQIMIKLESDSTDSSGWGFSKNS